MPATPPRLSRFRPSPLQFAIVAALGIYTSATLGKQGEDLVQQVIVTGKHTPIAITGTGDAAQLLRHKGVDFYSAGGVSRLPVLRGMNDDRINLVVDGAQTTSACANHMNPALSYIDASRISEVEVLAGITPVSLGGDSIAGTISLNSQAPRYALAEDRLLQEDSLSYHYRSNGHNQGIAASATLASDWLSLNYTGSQDEADSYRDGNGDKVADTLYRAENHALTLGAKGVAQELIVKLTHQDIPYQGFPNQYMDMVDNNSDGININYLRDFSWGRLDSRVTWQDVSHEMGFFSGEKPGVMPMKTEGTDVGYALKAEIPLKGGHSLRLGHEYHGFDLDDWWPAVPGSAMMGPRDYLNINNGERNRIALYGEAEYRLSGQWTTLAGIRAEQVRMDTGNVQAYNPGTMGMGSMGMGGMAGMSMANPDAAAAAAFNARDRERTDDNIDITLLARYQPSTAASYEFGYARKTRSPNLYERYSWGRGTMAMTMVGWFGDANGYVGDMDLDPEIAHTLSASISLGDAAGLWRVKATPYFTRVDDYVDAVQIGTFNPRMAMQVTRPLLQFANLDADIYGVDIEFHRALWNSPAWGQGNLRGIAAHTRGERRDNGEGLYQIMPLNARISLEHSINNWSSALDLQLVDRKDRVDPLRLEQETGSHTLVDVRTSYRWNSLTLSLGVNNLFDRNYSLPLGGVNYAGWLAGGMAGQFDALPGPGRSVQTGISYTF